MGNDIFVLAFSSLWYSFTITHEILSLSRKSGP